MASKWAQKHQATMRWSTGKEGGTENQVNPLILPPHLRRHPPVSLVGDLLCVFSSAAIVTVTSSDVTLHYLMYPAGGLGAGMKGKCAAWV